jgi:hypothetical protein
MTEREEHRDSTSGSERVDGGLFQSVCLDVAKHELLRVRAALEVNTACSPNRTMGAVASR